MAATNSRVFSILKICCHPYVFGHSHRWIGSNGCTPGQVTDLNLNRLRPSFQMADHRNIQMTLNCIVYTVQTNLLRIIISIFICEFIK